jgi:hypothetical protein
MTQRDIDTSKSLAKDFVDECLIELGVKAIAQALHEARIEGRDEAAKIVENSSLPDVYSEPCLKEIAAEIRSL